jgi:hypothetical protein
MISGLRTALDDFLARRAIVEHYLSTFDSRQTAEIKERKAQ